MWQKLFISTRKKKLTLRGLDNQDGQIAIFIALIFQIMFIFFAMLINVGLIVHDKINLQNSVDLAAYYGAERQAELLNKIAHINYQIRQEYKLLAWRQRILGTYAYNALTYNFPNPWPPDILDTTSPAICVDHAGWTEVLQKDPTAATDNCKKVDQFKPSVPQYDVITTWLGIHAALVNYYETVAQTAISECNGMGPLNWQTASLWFLEYKQSVQMRADMIRAIARNLSLPANRFLDIHNLPISVGVQKTYLKNLTEANLVSVASKSADAVNKASDFTFINGLSIGECETEVNDNPRWLHENQISPQLLYLDGVVIPPSGCQTVVKFVASPPANIAASPLFLSNGPAEGLLLKIVAGEPGVGIHNMPYSSLGFEKNPWCMAYVGVKAMTRPRKPFAPFGKPVTLVARAFASPFGGRIGPWNKSTWPSGNLESEGQLIDPLAVARTEERPAIPNVNPPMQPSDLIQTPIPNYSRYPGDQLGLASMLVKAFYGRQMLFSNLPVQGMQISGTYPLASYSHFMLETNTDSLAQSFVTAPPSPANAVRLRAAEISAVAPDLFDLTYYSIDADFYGMYFDPKVDKESDVGSGPISQGFNIHDQMKTANNSLIPSSVPVVNWLTPNLDYLLTGWIQGRVGDYGPYPAQFASCSVHPQYGQGWPPTPGFCVVGGRTGYSVRIMARKYLQKTSPPLELGGPGIVGKILNPLPNGW